MDLKFRLSFELSGDWAFTGDEQHLEIKAGANAQTLKLTAIDGKKRMDGSSHFSLSGGPFQTKEKASEIASAARVAVLYYAIRNRVGINVGQHNIQSFRLSKYGKQYFSDQLGAPVLEDRLGITIYEAESAARFLGFKVKGVVRKSVKTFTESIRSTLGKYEFTNPKAELAIELYAMSHFEAGSSARFLALFTALEALMETRPRSEAARQHIKTLLAKTQAADISEDEKDSLKGGLSWLYNESIGQAGRRMAHELLANREYESLRADVFFKKIYGIRNDLVHKGVVDRNKLHVLVGEMDRFVSDLLEPQFVA